MPAAGHPRRTLARTASVQGPALFTGQDTTLTLHPADAGGLRISVHGHDAPVHIDHLSARPVHPAFATLKPRCTSLDAGPHTLATLEHAISALAGLGITDAVLECDGPELPILDGSALPFADAVLNAGLRDLPETIQPLILTGPLEIRDGHAVLTAEPFDGIDYAYHLDYGPDSPIPAGTAAWTGDPADYHARIAPARTFSTEAEARQMQAMGLFARFTPADLLVIGPDGPIDNAWRFPDEPARHKLLDLIGDLALLGRPLHARVRATRTGHANTHALVRELRSLGIGH